MTRFEHDKIRRGRAILTPQRNALWSDLCWRLRRPTLTASRRSVLLWRDDEGHLCDAQATAFTGPRSGVTFARISINRLRLPPVAHRLLLDAGWIAARPAWTMELTTTMRELGTIGRTLVAVVDVFERDGLLPEHLGSTALQWWGGADRATVRDYAWTRSAYRVEWPDAGRTRPCEWTRSSKLSPMQPTARERTRR